MFQKKYTINNLMYGLNKRVGSKQLPSLGDSVDSLNGGYEMLRMVREGLESIAFDLFEEHNTGELTTEYYDGEKAVLDFLLDIVRGWEDKGVK